MADDFQDDSYIYEVLLGENTNFDPYPAQLQPDNDPSSAFPSSTAAAEGTEELEKGRFDLPSVDRGIGVEGFQRRKRNGQMDRFRKDFYRSQHVRALKKSIRQHDQNKFPTTNIHKITNAHQRSLWLKLRELYISHRDSLQTLSRTTAGPLTDGRARREEDMEEDQPKTHNDSFLHMFFAHSAVRAYHLLFSEFVFDASPKDMCAKMHIVCCLEANHTLECQQKWQWLKEHTQKGMLEEAGVEITQSDVETYQAHLV
jgi:hypothetical protein